MALSVALAPKQVLPLVSVVLTTYREVPADISRTIGDVLAQTLSDLELIVVFERDDQNCELVRTTFSDPRLVISCLTNESGRAARDLRAMSLVRGQYVARVEGNEFSDPELLEKRRIAPHGRSQINLSGGNREKAKVPLISVVMITYNEKRPRLRRAIDSILQQTIDDFEFLILFESDDENFEFVQDTYSDPRLRLIRLEPRRMRGQGRLAAHNMGMAMARGRYIARMDGDDVAYPDKFRRQIAFMSAHPEVGVLGTAGRLIDVDGREVGLRRFPTDHCALVKSFAITNPIFHSSVLLDRCKTGFNLRYKEHYCDDLELWLRLLGQGVKFSNLPDVLIDYTQPGQYTRPLADWRGNFRVRLTHWQLILRYPLMLVGILGFGLISVMPQAFADRLTTRSWISDRIRSIRNDGEARGRA